MTDLSTEELELLWILAEHPHATPADIAEAYDVPEPAHIEAEIEELLPSDDEPASEAAETLLESHDYEPDEWARDVSKKLDELVDEPDDADETDADTDTETYECPHCPREFESAHALSTHERYCDSERGLTDRQREALELVRKNPEMPQYKVAEELGVTDSRLSRIFRNSLGYAWGRRRDAVEEYLGAEKPARADGGTETCAFCPNERYTSVWVSIRDEDASEVAVCIDCFESAKAATQEAMTDGGTQSTLPPQSGSHYAEGSDDSTLSEWREPVSSPADAELVERVCQSCGDIISRWEGGEVEELLTDAGDIPQGYADGCLSCGSGLGAWEFYEFVDADARSSQEGSE